MPTDQIRNGFLVALPARPSVLVYVGLDLVGDGLIKLPFVRALRAAYPTGVLTWLAGKGPSAYRTVLAPLVAGLLDRVVDRASVDGSTAWSAGRLVDRRKFDVVIDTQRGVLNTLALRRLSGGVFVSSSARFLLSDVRPGAGYRRPPALSGQLFDLLELATGRPVPAPSGLRLDPAIVRLAARLLPDGACHVALAPGAGGQHKRWPLEGYIAVAAAQAACGRLPVLLLGPDELSLQPALSAALPGALFPLQDPAAAAFGQRPDLTIALAARCAVAVANDSGCGHMLAAAGTPLVLLFGPTDAAKFAPLSPSLTLIRAQSWGADEMRAIPVGAVLQAVDDALAKTNLARRAEAAAAC